MSNRTRTMGGYSGLPAFEYDNGSLIATHTPAKVGSLSRMDDVLVSGFRSRQRKGELFFNSMSSRQRTYSAMVASDHSFGPVATPTRFTSSGPYWYNLLPMETYEGNLVPNMMDAFTSNDVAMMLSEVSTGVLSKRGRGDTNLWETVAEFGQTLDLFRKPTLRLREWANKLTSARRVRPPRGREPVDNRKVVSDSASLWLTYRYGILPIVRDVEAIIQNLQKLRQSVRKTTRDSVRRNALSGSSGLISYGALRIPWSAEVTVECDVRGMSLDQVDWHLLDQLGFSAKSLLTLPWELVRLSFVLDWFVNVGDFLNAITPAIGWTHLGSCAVIKKTYKTVYTVGEGSTVTGANVLSSPPKGVVEVTGVSRDRVKLVVPRILVKSDFGFDKATRVADAWALSTGAVYSALGLSKPRFR